jgi:hypothetical protein
MMQARRISAAPMHSPLLILASKACRTVGGTDGETSAAIAAPDDWRDKMDQAKNGKNPRDSLRL